MEVFSSWDYTYIDVAERLSKESKCQSKKVCAIAVKDNRIIATGLNGTVSGLPNCCNIFPNGVITENRDEHHKWSLENEIHAEINLLSDAAKRGISLVDSTVYINLMPCAICSLVIANTGIKRLVFSKYYDIGNSCKTNDIFNSKNISIEYIGK